MVFKVPMFRTSWSVLVIAGACWAGDAQVECATCHSPQAGQWRSSVHADLKCQECHGGEAKYDLAAEVLQGFLNSNNPNRSPFDHGASFRGKAPRAKVPERCGTCHADVERMNPYGLRTDQLAAYWTSGHGKTLASKGDDRVAVCIDCHGSHDVQRTSDPTSRTHPFNVPTTCATCHSQKALMDEFKLHTEVVDEYRVSVHGRLLLEQNDSGAPTCATCHGNHAALPPGFRTIGAVCGKCHEHASKNFETSIHARQPEHKGCVQCHGGGENRHFHLIDRITKPTGVMLQRYTHLMSSHPAATPQQVTEAIHPDPRKIMTQALPSCMECHEDIDEDKNLRKMFELLDDIAAAERLYLETGRRLDEVGRGVLLVDKVRFTFEDAKTHLIELAPLQHTLDNSLVAGKVAELERVCAQVHMDLDRLEQGLSRRYAALAPIWVFALLFSGALYLKYKRLKAAYVRPAKPGAKG